VKLRITIFEISLVVFMPNITTNPAITYTYSDQRFIAILRAHDFSQSSRVLKLFALPWHPPKVKRSQSWVWGLKKYRGIAALQGPVLGGRLQVSSSLSAEKRNEIVSRFILSEQAKPNLTSWNLAKFRCKPKTLMA